MIDLEALEMFGRRSGSVGICLGMFSVLCVWFWYAFESVLRSGYDRLGWEWLGKFGVYFPCYLPSLAGS